MNGRLGLVIAGALLLLLLALAPLASDAPDGLEYTLEGYAASTEAADEPKAAPKSAATVVLSGMAGAAIVLGLGWAWGAVRKAR